jgi:uncharacterized membrane protein YhaH (DUF805 family)
MADKQVVDFWFNFGVILIAVAFLIYIAAAFGTAIKGLLVNGLIIFVIVYRSYYEIKAGRIRYHAVGAMSSTLLLLFFGNFGQPFWLLTTFLIISFLVAQILVLVQQQREPKQKPKKRILPPGKLLSANY